MNESGTALSTGGITPCPAAAAAARVVHLAETILLAAVDDVYDGEDPEETRRMFVISAAALDVAAERLERRGSEGRAAVYARIARILGSGPPPGADVAAAMFIALKLARSSDTCGYGQMVLDNSGL